MAQLSYSAGTYLCNAAMYTAINNAPSGVTAGFIHIPNTPELVVAEAKAGGMDNVQESSLPL